MSTAAREAVKVAAIIVGGAVIGAGLGILFAPKSGAETRNEVARAAKRAQLQATRFGRAVKSSVHEAVERGKVLVHGKDRKSVPEAA